MIIKSKNTIHPTVDGELDVTNAREVELLRL